MPQNMDKQNESYQFSILEELNEKQEIKNDQGDKNLLQIDTKQRENIQIYFASSLLYLRGDSKVPMPLEKQNCILSYNGEIYEEILKNNANNIDSNGNSFNFLENDTCQLFEFLHKHSMEFYQKSQTESNTKNDQDNNYSSKLIKKLNQYYADFAFVFYDNLNKKIVVAKDHFGKRSLLMGFTKDGIVFSSAPISIKSGKLIQEKDEQDEQEEGDQNVQNKDDQQGSQQDIDLQQKQRDFVEKKYFQEYLSACQKEWVELPSNQIMIGDIVDLDINGEEKYEQNELKEKQQIIWNSYELNKEVLNCEKLIITENMTPNSNTPQEAIDIVNQHLENSVRKLVENILQYKQYFTPQQNITELKYAQEKQKESNGICLTNSHISVLFSGGLDSTLITYYIDKLIPPEASIDLLNLSFHKSSSDRKTAIEAYKELKIINPKRSYNLIFIDQDIQDIQKYEDQLLKLIYPKITHMDFNIALVLHIATKGVGTLYQEVEEEQKEQEKVISNAKVVMSGLGADEVFGGYSRYRVSYQRGGFEALQQEMKFDLNRIWIRNLGRDDRAISANGKEVRFPFLDVQLIQAIQSISFSYFTNFSELPYKKIKQLPNRKKKDNKNCKQSCQGEEQKIQQQSNQNQNENENENQQMEINQEKQLKNMPIIQISQHNNGNNQDNSNFKDKLLLRNLALQLGLQAVSGFKKKAIQFGTGLAKQSNKRAFGSHRKGKGTSQYQLPA